MSDKVHSAKEAAIAVLKKTEELLKSSEVLAKYETENSKKVGYKPFGVKQKEEKRDSISKDRLKSQVAPTDNPKEEAEGNNKPDGMEPRYEFKDKVKKELAKEAMGKAENPDEKEDAKLGEDVEHLVEDHMVENKDAEEKEGHKIMKCEKCGHEMGKEEKGAYPKELASRNIEQESKKDWPGGHKQAIAVGISEARAGKDVSKASEDPHHAEAFMPIKHHVSAKLAKFMEWKHARKKAAK